jgi:hypothetical protein
VACPCNDPEISELWVATVAGEIEIEACFDNLFGVTGVTFLYTSEFGPYIAAGKDPESGGFLCADISGAFLPISEEQSAVCVQQLEDTTTLFGVTCGLPPV